MKLSDKIRIIRKARGLSQEALGDSLSRVSENGISRQSVSDWENGKAEPKLDNIRDLAEVLNVSFDALLDENIDLNDNRVLSSVLKHLSPEIKQTVNSVRLKLAYTLLSDKGFLVVNIDDGERDRLKELCISIFGIGLVKVYQWKKKHEFFDTNRVVLNPNKIQTDYEYIIVCRKSSNAVLRKLMQPYIENGILKEKESDVPEVFDCFGTTSSAKDEIKSLFGKREYFSTPKPLKLMKELIRATTSGDSLILDFFAGSGTTGHACFELNAEDGGSRKFILVSNKESDICETVTDKRLQIASDRFNEKYVFMK